MGRNAKLPDKEKEEESGLLLVDSEIEIYVAPCDMIHQPLASNYCKIRGLRTRKPFFFFFFFLKH